MTPEELLQRLSRTLRKEIGPAIDSEYPKTQAYMASVVTQKLGKQVGLAQVHEAADSAELEALINDVDGFLRQSPANAQVADALAELAESRNKTSLCTLIETLYAARGEIGESRFSRLLDRVRRSLRANIDRQMEVAR